jgi:hypothetical protein
MNLFLANKLLPAAGKPDAEKKTLKHLKTMEDN